MSVLILGLCWMCIALVVYHHALYPLILRLHHRSHPRPETTSVDPAKWPEIGVLIPCYNEESVIAQKLYNLASCDYPQDALSIYVVCDGCTDNTAAVAREAAQSWTCQGLRVKVIEHASNRGKLGVLTESIAGIAEPLLALTDASALISLDALRIAARRFEDPRMGGLSGRYHLLDAGGAGQSAYWAYQVFLKQLEDATGSTLGAHGAFYMIRRDLFQAPPAGTINDDFVIPMCVIRQGFTMRYEPAILALELEHLPERDEQRRRRRIAAGNVQMCLQLADLMRPRHGWVAFNFFSGKCLRACMPVLLVFALLSSLLSVFTYPWMWPVLAAQLGGYGLASWQQCWPTWPNLKLMRILHYVVAGHISGARGLLDYVFRQGKVSWA